MERSMERSMKIKERHSRNIPAMSCEDMEKLSGSSALIAGCGGIGGYIMEYLTRAGIGALTVADGDVFSESNLNRQILSTAENIGKFKAEAAAERIRLIDPDIRVTPVNEYLTEENAASLMENVDIVMDALDNVESRLILEDAAAKTGRTIVHGAISGWELQVMLVPPGSGLLRQLYFRAPGQKNINPSLPVTPAACASFQAALALRYLCGHDTPLKGSLLTGSLLDMDFDIIQLS